MFYTDTSSTGNDTRNPIIESTTVNVPSNIPTESVSAPKTNISKPDSMTKFNIHLSSVLKILFAPNSSLVYEGSTDDVYVALMALDDFKDITFISVLKSIADKLCTKCNVSINQLIKIVIMYMNGEDSDDYFTKYPFSAKDRCIMYLIDLFDLDDNDSSDKYRAAAAKVIIGLAELYESKIPNIQYTNFNTAHTSV